MKTGSGIASTVLVPSQVRTQVKGVNVCVRLDTLYPFRDTLTYTVTASEKVAFDFSIRIPETAQMALVDGQEAEPGTFHTINKEWSGETRIIVILTPKEEWIKRPNGLFAYQRGPLVFALPIRERREAIEYERDGVARTYPFCDYYLYPDEEWAYGFAGDKMQVVMDDGFDLPFSNSRPPLYVQAEMAPVAWPMEHGMCATVPASREAVGPAVVKRLYPYGCTNLRLTEMPRV